MPAGDYRHTIFDPRVDGPVDWTEIVALREFLPMTEETVRLVGDGLLRNGDLLAALERAAMAAFGNRYCADIQPSKTLRGRNIAFWGAFARIEERAREHGIGSSRSTPPVSPGRSGGEDAFNDPLPF